MAFSAGTMPNSGRFRKKLGLAGLLNTAVRALLHDDEGRSEEHAGEQAQSSADGNVGLIRQPGQLGGVDNPHVRGAQGRGERWPA